MDALLNQISSSILDHQLFQRGEKILVGVSGGLDSVVLLHALNSLSVEWGWDLTVAHLNHRLRGRSSAGDARFVETLSRRLGIRFCGSVAEVRTIARRDCISLEMAGRQARHAFFKQAALDNNCTSVALAHHADDQVELFFLRLLRGSGEGLGGMRWIGALPNHSQIRLVRPLLNLPKSVLKEYAATMSLCFREDASNADLDFRRNRIRHELLPLLRKSYQAGLDSVVTRTMNILSAEADCVGDLARQWMKARQPDFGSLPVAVQRRALQSQLYAAGIIPDFVQIETLRSTPHQAVNLSQAQRPSKVRERAVARDEAGSIYFPTPPAEVPVEPEVEVPVELGFRGNHDSGEGFFEVARRDSPGPRSCAPAQGSESVRIF